MAFVTFKSYFTLILIILIEITLYTKSVLSYCQSEPIDEIDLLMYNAYRDDLTHEKRFFILDNYYNNYSLSINIDTFENVKIYARRIPISDEKVLLTVKNRGKQVSNHFNTSFVLSVEYNLHKNIRQYFYYNYYHIKDTIRGVNDGRANEITRGLIYGLVVATLNSTKLRFYSYYQYNLIHYVNKHPNNQFEFNDIKDDYQIHNFTQKSTLLPRYIIPLTAEFSLIIYNDFTYSIENEDNAIKLQTTLDTIKSRKKIFLANGVEINKIRALYYNKYRKDYLRRFHLIGPNYENYSVVFDASIFKFDLNTNVQNVVIKLYKTKARSFFMDSIKQHDKDVKYGIVSDSIHSMYLYSTYHTGKTERKFNFIELTSGGHYGLKQPEPFYKARNSAIGLYCLFYDVNEDIKFQVFLYFCTKEDRLQLSISDEFRETGAYYDLSLDCPKDRNFYKTLPLYVIPLHQGNYSYAVFIYRNASYSVSEFSRSAIIENQPLFPPKRILRLDNCETGKNPPEDEIDETEDPDPIESSSHQYRHHHLIICTLIFILFRLWLE